MAASIPYELRKPSDEIPPEAFPRLQLDRSISTVNSMFIKACGTEMSPIHTAVKWARLAGRAALLDVGCGTGNTLRTWKRTVAKLAPCNPELVTANGISLHDYSRESRYPQVETACSDGTMDYMVGDALTHLKRFPPGSTNVSVAFNSLIHMRNPDAVLEQMVRVTSPGGTTFFNISPEQNISSSPVVEYINALDGMGYPTHMMPTRIILEPGVTANYVLCWIRTPQE